MPITTTGTVANAAANGTLLATPTLRYTTLPMMSELAPPTRVGGMYSPTVSEKVKIDPATTPVSASGSSTRRNVVGDLAPRSPEASSRESGTRSMAAQTGRIMNGSQMYENTIHIAVFE